VEVFIFQRDGPLVFRFPYDPFVRLIEVIHYVCPVFFVPPSSPTCILLFSYPIPLVRLRSPTDILSSLSHLRSDRLSRFSC
jgi:hypothetical protein